MQISGMRFFFPQAEEERPDSPRRRQWVSQFYEVSLSMQKYFFCDWFTDIHGYSGCLSGIVTKKASFESGLSDVWFFYCCWTKRLKHVVKSKHVILDELHFETKSGYCHSCCPRNGFSTSSTCSMAVAWAGVVCNQNPEPDVTPHCNSVDYSYIMLAVKYFHVY